MSGDEVCNGEVVMIRRACGWRRHRGRSEQHDERSHREQQDLQSVAVRGYRLRRSPERGDRASS